MFLLNIRHIGFQSQTFWGSSFRYKAQVFSWLVWGRSSILYMCVFIYVWHLSRLWVATAGVGFDKRVSLPLLHISLWLFYPYFWSKCSLSSQVFFRGICFIHNCMFVVYVGGGKFRIFLYSHLELTHNLHFDDWQIKKNHLVKKLETSGMESCSHYLGIVTLGWMAYQVV